MFRLAKSETKPLTKELAAQFQAMEASPTERELNEARVKHLREKGEKGFLVTFGWSIANYAGRPIRMNGQHSSKALLELDGKFPEGLFVHMDTYDCQTKEDLALLFRQFDDRKSGRSPGDVAGAYQGIYETLHGLDKGVVKLAVEGIAWFRRAVLGEHGQTGDDIYAMMSDESLYGFFRYLTEVFSIKTPELKKMAVAAAMHGTFAKNEEAAKHYWSSVARGGSEFDEQDPTTVLDTWLKAVHDGESRRVLKVKPANIYQGCIYSWNSFRQEKSIKDIKYKIDKGYFEIIG